MIYVVSPYHLTTREAPALVPLLIGEGVLTLVPGSGSDSAGARAAADRHAVFGAMVRGWSWAEELFRAGLIAPGYAGRDAAEDVREALVRMRTEPTLSGLLEPDVFEDEDSSLRAISTDVIRAGANPAVCLPLFAGLDRMASRFGFVAARGAPISVAQKAEARLGERLGGVVLPALIEADGTAILRTRELLAPELEELRRVLLALVEGEDRGVAPAVAAYADAFARRRVELTEVEDEDDPRVVTGSVSVQFLRLPVDAVVRSSVSAARRSGAARAAPSHAGSDLALADELANATLIGSIITVLNRDR